ncbi:MAG: tRNA CCA-pyrophosphorylase [bacterium]|nr:tRNA CCA-pyrophosphorylase [bacterium]
MNIGPYSYEDFIKEIISYHGNLAPGLIIGGFMVEKAQKELQGEFFDVICETGSCLPDAVQMLTSCTIGNGWLKIIDVGRFALTFYEKYTGKGVRVFLEAEKLDRWPEIKNWFMKLKPKAEQDRDRLVNEIKEAGMDILGLRELVVPKDFLGKKGSGPIKICPECGEAYPKNHGETCRACRGALPYSSGDE